MPIPDDLRYSPSHEWVRLDGGIATVGITDHAQSELGDIVYLGLPEPGRILSAGEKFGEIESVKAVSDLYSPISGEVTEINESAVDAAEVVNEDAFGDGWLIRLQISNAGELEGLLDASAYDALLARIAH